MSIYLKSESESKGLVERLDGIEEEDLKMMLRIRHFELNLLIFFSQGLIKGTAHTCIGQEYIPVALNPFISENDFVVSNHRGHGHYIARYSDIEGILSEIMGKKGAICNGIGGSQHLYRERFISTGIQAEGIAVATGISWSYKFRKENNICFVYIGDGTLGRGSVYESMNFASIWNLPMVIIVENNGIALSTDINKTMAGTIMDRAKAFGIDYQYIESHNVNNIRDILKAPIDKVRYKNRPLLVEFHTERVAAHSKGDDSRTGEELENIKKRYWYNIMLEQAPKAVIECEREVEQEVSAICELVKQKEGAVWQLYE